MKEIVLESEEKTLPINSIPEDDDDRVEEFYEQFFGVEFGSGDRAYLRKENYYDSHWKVYAYESFSESNAHCHSGYFKEVVKSLIKSGHKVLVFEKLSELAIWMEQVA